MYFNNFPRALVTVWTVEITCLFLKFLSSFFLYESFLFLLDVFYAHKCSVLWFVGINFSLKPQFHFTIFRGAGERNRGYALLMTANM